MGRGQVSWLTGTAEASFSFAALTAPPSISMSVSSSAGPAGALPHL